MPYCTVVKLKDGATAEIAKTFRIYHNNEIVVRFREEMKSENVEIKASDTLLYSILNTCPTSRSYFLECVDSFVVEGMKVNKIFEITFTDLTF